jgi:hypothetical protein
MMDPDPLAGITPVDNHVGFVVVEGCHGGPAFRTLFLFGFDLEGVGRLGKRVKVKPAQVFVCVILGLFELIPVKPPAFTLRARVNRDAFEAGSFQRRLAIRAFHNAVIFASVSVLLGHKQVTFL